MKESEISAGLAETPNYRYVDRVGTQLHVAGEMPRDRHGNLVGSGNAAELTTHCLRILISLLSRHGFSDSDIRKFTIYVVGSREELQSAWSSVTKWFGGEVPPATLLGVSLLGYEGRVVEIDATVVADPDPGLS